jgi:hypothetical protein
MRGNTGEIVNLRHARKQRARIAATKDAAAVSTARVSFI